MVDLDPTQFICTQGTQNVFAHTNIEDAFSQTSRSAQSAGAKDALEVEGKLMQIRLK